MKRYKALFLALAFIFVWAANAPVTQACVLDEGLTLLQEPDEPGGPGGQARRGRGGPERRLFAQLNLTDAQKEQIKALHQQARTASQPYRDQLKANHEEMKAATANGAFNEEAMRALAAKAAQLNGELRVIDLRTQTAVYNALTPEQKAKLEELRKERRGPRGGQGRPGR